MPKVYAVRKGRQTGIFNTWPECQAQVTGFSGAEYKSFSTRYEAEAWIESRSLYKKPASAPPAMACSEEVVKNYVDGLMSSQRKEIHDEKIPPITQQYQPVPSPRRINIDIMPTIKHDSTLRLPSQPKHEKKLPDRLFYTDGSCQNEKGGWAYVIVENGEIIHERSGAMLEYPTTNNRAELMAVLKVLEENSGDLFIRPDSDYTIKCASVWWPGWKRRGWKKADGSTPENLDLIHEILRLQEGRNITYDHVYGHKGNPYNERCDKLAEAAYCN